MNYEELKELTQQDPDHPGKSRAGYEEPPEMPTEEELQKFDEVLRQHRESLKQKQ